MEGHVLFARRDIYCKITVVSFKTTKPIISKHLNMVFHGDGNSGSFQEGTTDNYFYREISKIVLKAYIDPGKIKNQDG